MIGVPKPVRVRDDGLRAYVRSLPCLLAHEQPCTCGPYINVVTKRIVIQAAHVRGRGAGGDDPNNLVPLCDGHHKGRRDSLHLAGTRSFERAHAEALAGLTLKVIARMLDKEYRGADGPPEAA